MDESEFWLRFWKYATVLACVVAVSTAGSCQYTKYTIRQMAEAGVDPMVADCAIAFDVSRERCAFVAAGQQ